MVGTRSAGSSHRRSLAATLAVAGLFAIGAAPVLAAPAEHTSFTLAGGVVDCGVHQYTFTGGTFDLVVHDGASPSGNNQNSVEARTDNVTAVDAAGNLYRVVGIFHFGGSFNPNIDSGPFHFGMKLQIINSGSGRVDNVNVVLSSSPFGSGRDFVSIGSCVPLG